jgi:hypothetical protein
MKSTDISFTFTDDYKADFERYVSELWSTNISGNIKALQNDEKGYLRELETCVNVRLVEELHVNLECVQADIRELFVEKNRLVDALTNGYVEHSGEIPESIQLDRLATWILKGAEQYGDILTDRQLRRRQNDIEFLFFSPEARSFRLEKDGNKRVKIAPSMDSDESHKVRVKLPHDNMDKREFNGPLRKYFQ